MKPTSINNFTKEECILWLNSIGQLAYRSIEDLKCKIKRFSLYPKLVERLKKQSERNYEFKCSLNPLDIPATNAPWKTGDYYLPKVTEDIFY